MQTPTQTLHSLLDSLPLPSIRHSLQHLTRTRQHITYHAMVSSPSTYLHVRGLSQHNQQQFDYINRLLHGRVLGVLGKVRREELEVRDREGELRGEEEGRRREEEGKERELWAEVEAVVAGVDLPVALFGKGEQYWCQENPKTIEARRYVEERSKEDQRRRERIKSEYARQEMERQKREKEQRERQEREEEERRRKLREEVKIKIEQLKRNSEERAKAIEQSQKRAKSLQPMFLKIAQQSQKAKLSALQQHKKKLTQLRRLHKSIDFDEIEQHKLKLMQLQKQRQVKKIINQPIKVSFKSKFHSSVTARTSLGAEYQTSKSLYEKKKQYGEIIKSQFKPKIDDKLVQQMQERLKMMRRKRVRKNPKKKQQQPKNSDDEDDDDDDYQDQPPAAKKQPQKPAYNQDDYDSEDDDEDQQQKPAPRVRGQDQDPDRKQRYELGVGYLQYVRSLKKKNNSTSESRLTAQAANQPQQPIKNSQRYKNYLLQLSKTHSLTSSPATATGINTSRIRMTDNYNKSIINSGENVNVERIEYQTRRIEDKIQREEQLMKYKKMRNEEVVAKKVEIDNAVVETIKARLAMMGK